MAGQFTQTEYRFIDQETSDNVELVRKNAEGDTVYYEVNTVMVHPHEEFDNTLVVVYEVNAVT
jgi:hypothetical protein